MGRRKAGLRFGVTVFLTLSVVLALTSCGGGGGSSQPPGSGASTVSGTAATGGPIAGAQITPSNH